MNLEILKKAQKTPVDNSNEKTVPAQKGAWRKKLTFVHVNAKPSENPPKAPVQVTADTSFAPDISIVAFNVSKDITAEKIKQYVLDKGVDVVDCELITKWKDARTLSFKITIKAKHLEITKADRFWPYRVGVRFFKNFRPKTSAWDVHVNSVNSSNTVVQTSNGTQETSQAANIQCGNSFSVLSDIPTDQF